MKPGAPSRRAFTLIELLVVIAILGILAALLLSALTAAKRKAQQAGCLSNLKQLALASYVYANDTGFHAAYNSPNNPDTLWMGAIDYGKQRKVLLCPATHEPQTVAAHNQMPGAADTAWTWAPSTSTNIYVGSFAFNGWLFDIANHGAAQHPEFMMSKPGTVQQPSQTPVFCDALWDDCWPYETDSPASNLYDDDGKENILKHTGMERFTIARHSAGNPASAPRNFDTSQRLPGAVDMGLADGHAELAKIENLWQYYWHRDWQPPATRPQ
jgi:prepilin-type N-terminal cleavage/methylation domain-containing protein